MEDLVPDLSAESAFSPVELDSGSAESPHALRRGGIEAATLAACALLRASHSELILAGRARQLPSLTLLGQSLYLEAELLLTFLAQHSEAALVIGDAGEDVTALLIGALAHELSCLELSGTAAMTATAYRAGD